MEDPDEIANYRLRPLSRTSSQVTLSPNTSSLNLPSRGNANGTEMSDKRDISSTYLQERLKERRAGTLKVNKQRRGSESTGDSASRMGSSPTIASSDSRSGDRRPTTSSAGEKKGSMGVKAMEETMDKLQKQNWDFKLEIYHRRQKQEALEEKNAALEDEVASLTEKLAHTESGNVELQAMNNEMMVQLETHDQAVEEAIRIICDLEAKIEQMEKERSPARSVNTDRTTEPCSSPPQLDTQDLGKRMALESTKTLSRMPSFLSDHTRSTEALRSLFRLGQPDTADLPKLAEETENAESEGSDDDGRHSPQLSVLSESSFRSVYGGDATVFAAKQKKKAQLESPIKAWIDEQPIKSHTKSSPGSFLYRQQGREKYLSLDHVASSPIRRIDGMKHRMEHALRNTKGLRISNTPKNEPEISRKSSASSANIQTYTKYLNDRLPPTPDTMSTNTNTLRHQQNSYDTLPRSGSEDDKSSAASRLKTSKQLYFDEASNILLRNHHGSPNSRPRTAGEAMASLRDGHGWDTDSHIELSEATATDPWLATAQESGQRQCSLGVQPPRMFDFSTTKDLSPIETRFNASDNGHNSDRAGQQGRISRSVSVGAAHKGSDTLERTNVGDNQSAQLDVKDSKIGSGPRKLPRPPVSSRTDKRPPISNTSTPTRNPTTPSTGAAESNICRKNSLSKRSRLPGFLGGRSETLPDISSYTTEKSNDQSPSSQRSQLNQFHKKRNSISDKIQSSPIRDRDLRNNPLMSPRFPARLLLNGTSPAIEDNRRHVSGLRIPSAASRKPDGRPSTSGSLDSKLPIPISGPFASGARHMTFKSIPDYNNRSRNKTDFGGDGAGDPRDYEEECPFENAPLMMAKGQDPDLVHVCPNCECRKDKDEGGGGKMEKFKGAVLKTLGRR